MSDNGYLSEEEFEIFERLTTDTNASDSDVSDIARNYGQTLLVMARKTEELEAENEELKEESNKWESRDVAGGLELKIVTDQFSNKVKGLEAKVERYEKALKGVIQKTILEVASVDQVLFAERIAEIATKALDDNE